jgi:hypothetical protein
VAITRCGDEGEDEDKGEDKVKLKMKIMISKKKILVYRL